MTKSFFCATFVAVALFFVGGMQHSLAADQPGAGQAQAKRNKVIFSVTDNDAGKWNLVLSNAASVQQNIGAENIDVEVVVWGPGINMLKLESVAGNQVNGLTTKGIKIVACETTMHALKLAPQDMLASAGYVPGGVIELMQKQQQGWAYIRP